MPIPAGRTIQTSTTFPDLSNPDFHVHHAKPSGSGRAWHDGCTMTAQSTSRANRMPLLAWLLLALSAAWCVVWFVHALGYWEDDAWIHLVFARSVASGQGFAFNGRVVYGDTSPLWMGLLAAFHAVIPDWMSAGKTLAALAAVFALRGAYFFSRSLVGEKLSAAQSNVFAAMMVLVLVTNPYFGYWAFSGMEALAAAGLVCWGLVAAKRAEASAGYFLVACGIAGIAPLLRPEMSIFCVLLMLLLGYGFLRNAEMRRRWGVMLTGIVLAGTPAIAWAMYALRTFGMVVPNTNGAKRAAPGDSVAMRVLHLYTLGFPLAVFGWSLLTGWVVWMLLRRKQNQILPTLGLLSLTGWLLLVWTKLNGWFYVLDHTFVQTRYIFVTAPVLTIAILALGAMRWPKLYRVGVIFGVVFGIATSLLAPWNLIHNKVQVDRDYADLAAYVRTLPPDAAVANYSIGESGFFSEHTIVDTGGITRPGAIPFMFDVTDARMLAWIRSQGAGYWVIDHQPEPGAVLVWSRDIPETGWYLNPSRYKGTERLQLWKLAK